MILVSVKFVRTVCAVLSFVLLSGCSVFGFGDRTNDYRRSEEIAPLKIPEDLESTGVGVLYPIPTGGEVVSYEIDEEFEVPRPRSVSLNESDTTVKIQRLGGYSWILLASSPNQAWTRVRSYLTRNGIPSAKADLSNGTIETGLFQLSDDESRNQQFLISLSQGVQINSTEIEILHRDFDASITYDQLPEWSDVSQDSDRETWLRDGLAAGLADANAAGTASLLGQEIGAEPKVELVATDDAFPYLQMHMSFERAWASVGYALKKESTGFSLVEDDIGSRTYVSSYTEVQTEKPGFFKRLFSSKLPTETYRVTFVERGRSIEARVAYADGSEMPARESFLVLQRIRNHLG